MENGYATAVALQETGKLDEAISVFSSLGDYLDASVKIKEVTYQKAEALEASGNQAEANDLFLDLGDYKDASQRPRMGYAYVCSDAANLRSLPDASSKKIKTLKKYALLEVLNETEQDGTTWIHVFFNGQEGYLNSNYVKHLGDDEYEAFITSDQYEQGKRNNE